MFSEKVQKRRLRPSLLTRLCVLAMFACQAVTVSQAKRSVLVELKDFKSLVKLKAICSPTQRGYDIRRSAVGLPAGTFRRHVSVPTLQPPLTPTPSLPTPL